MFYVLLPSAGVRTRGARSTSNRQGLMATFHYVPLHSSAGGRRFAVRPTECPVTDDVSGRILRLPFFTTISADDTQRVAGAFLAALRG